MVRKLIMAKTLGERIKEARQVEIKVNEIIFTARRATFEEMLAYAGAKTSDADISRKHITGWSGVKESDLIEGGSAEQVPFDKALFDDVIGDQQEWWLYIANGVASKALESITQKAESKKK